MGSFCCLGHGKVWHMRVVCLQFCPCFSFRLLAFPVSVLVSPSPASQIPNAFTPWTLMNFTECTVNPVLLCHIEPPAHVHILGVWQKCREPDAYLKLYAPGSSTRTHFFMASSWLQYVFLPLPSCYSLGYSTQNSCLHSGPSWRTVCCAIRIVSLLQTEFLWQPNCKHSMAGLQENKLPSLQGDGQ